MVSTRHAVAAIAVVMVLSIVAFCSGGCGDDNPAVSWCVLSPSGEVSTDECLPACPPSIGVGPCGGEYLGFDAYSCTGVDHACVILSKPNADGDQPAIGACVPACPQISSLGNGQPMLSPPAPRPGAVVRVRRVVNTEQPGRGD